MDAAYWLSRMDRAGDIMCITSLIILFFPILLLILSKTLDDTFFEDVFYNKWFIVIHSIVAILTICLLGPGCCYIETAKKILSDDGTEKLYHYTKECQKRYYIPDKVFQLLGISPDDYHKEIRIRRNNMKKGLSKKTIAKKLVEQLATLPNDWDGYGASKVLDGCIKRAFQVIVKVPMRFLSNIYPNPSGTLSFEFVGDICFNSDGTIDMDNSNLKRLSAELGTESFTYYLKMGDEVIYGEEQPYTDDNLKKLSKNINKLRV